MKTEDSYGLSRSCWEWHAWHPWHRAGAQLGRADDRSERQPHGITHGRPIGERGDFTLAAGSATNAGSTNITATTTWALKASRTAVAVDAYFASAAAALTDGAGDNIPSSAFFIADNGGASTALINTVAFGAANAGLQLANVPSLPPTARARAPTSWLSTST